MLARLGSLADEYILNKGLEEVVRGGLETNTDDIFNDTRPT